MEINVGSVLPVDVLSTIFSRLELHEVASIRRVCKFWKEASKHWMLWKTLYINITKISEPGYVSDWEKLLKEVVVSRDRFLKGHCTTTVLKGHTAGVQCVQYSDNMVITGGRDGTIRKWILDPDVPQGYSTICANLPTSKRIRETVRSIQFDKTRLVIGTRSENIMSTVQIWDVNTLECLNVFEWKGVLVGTKFDDKRIVTVLDEDVIIIDWETLKETQRYNTGIQHISSFQIDPLKVVVGGSGMAGFSLENGMKIWGGLAESHITCFQYHNNILICSHQTGEYCLTVYDMDTVSTEKGSLGTMLYYDNHVYNVTCLQWDVMKLVAGRYDGTITIFELPNPEEILKSKHKGINLKRQTLSVGSHCDSVYDLQFIGSKIVTGSGDKTAMVWDFSPAAIRKVLAMQDSKPPSVAVDLGKTLPVDVLSDIFSRLDLRDIPKIRRVCKYWKEASKHWLIWKITKNTLKVHVRDWEKLLYDAIVSRERFLKGHCTTTVLKGHAAGVQCVQYSDNMIITGGRDGTIRKWILDPNDPQVYTSICSSVHTGGSNENHPARFDTRIQYFQFNSTILVVASIVGIQLWDLEKFECYWTFELNDAAGIWGLQFNDKTIVVGVTEREDLGSHIEQTQFIYFIDWKTLSIVKYKPGLATACCMQMDALKVVIGGSGMIGLSLETGLKVWEGLSDKNIGFFQYHRNTLVATSINGWELGPKISIYDMDTCIELMSFYITGLSCFQWDEMKLVAGCSSGSIIIQSMPSPSELDEIRENPSHKIQRELPRTVLDVGGHTDTVYCLQFFGSKIVSGSGDKKAIVWDFHPDSIKKVLEKQVEKKKKGFFQRLFK